MVHGKLSPGKLPRDNFPLPYPNPNPNINSGRNLLGGNLGGTSYGVQFYDFL